MSRIALVGYFGWGNFGDELFVKAHQQYLGKKHELFVANDLLEEPYFSRPVTEIVAEADGVLIGGGDLVNPARVSPLYWDMAWLKKPVFIYGIGVPRQTMQREKVLGHYKEFMSHDNCKLVVARDIESYHWLRDNLQLGDKLTWYPDAVCAMGRPEPHPSKEKVLGVVMREHRSLSQDMGPLREMIDKAKKLDYKIRHLVLATGMLGEADLKRAEMIAEPGEEIIHSEDLDELCRQIGACSMLATIKFHGMVVATMYGVPSIAMSVTPKNRNFLRVIERPEMLASYTDSALEKRLSYFPSRIPQVVRGQLFRQAKEGYALLNETLDKHLVD